jgi:hypothetical protein
MEVDLPRLQETIGREIGFVLGIDYLQTFSFTMNDGRPNLIARATDYPTDKNTWPISVQQNGSRGIAVEFPVLGSREMIFDTGFSDHLSLNKSFADAMIRSGDAIEISTTDRLDASGIGSKSVLVIRGIKLFGIQFQNVPALVGQINAVGMGLLRHIDFVADFPNSVLCVTTDPV